MGSLLSSVLGTSNTFQAQAPVNQFRSRNPVSPGTLDQANAQASGGAGPASGTIGRQNLLADSLAAAAEGKGPNPALEQLHQTTSQNINTAAGQAASARGVNPALAARLAVDAGSGINQQAAGQAATMTAEQQIAAREQLGSTLAQTGAVQLGQQGAGTSQLRTAGSLDLGAQGLDEQVAAQNAGLQLGTEQLNAGVAAQNADISSKLVGGMINGAGAFLGMDEGGEVPDVPSGGAVHDYLDQVHAPAPTGLEGAETPTLAPTYPTAPTGFEGAETPTDLPAGRAASSGLGKAVGAGLGKVGTSMQGDTMQAFRSATSRPVQGAIFNRGGSIYAAHGGAVPAMVSPQEVVVPPSVAHSSPERARSFVASGKGKVPGKAQVSGDSPKNDTVHATLQPGAVVVPRSIMQGKDAAKHAATFIASVLKRGASKKYAVGGKVSPGPAAATAPVEVPELVDLSDGGMVESNYRNAAAADKVDDVGGGRRTARGAGRSETRRRIKRADGPRPEAT